MDGFAQNVNLFGLNQGPEKAEGTPGEKMTVREKKL